MPPNQKPFQVESIEAPYAPPLPELLSGEPLSSSDDAFSSTSASSLEDHFEIPTSTSIYEPIEIPIEQNLRELLVSRWSNSDLNFWVQCYERAPVSAILR